MRETFEEGFFFESTEDPITYLWESIARRETRFKGLEMTHPTTLEIHTMRVEQLTFEIAFIVAFGANSDQSFRESLTRGGNFNLMLETAYLHDFAEAATSDITTDRKERMSPEERQLLEDRERLVMSLLAAYRHKDEDGVNDFMKRYKELKDKSTLESQVIDIADKLDSVSEALHQVLCYECSSEEGLEGESSFLDVLDRYRRRLKRFEKYPVWPLLTDSPLPEYPEGLPWQHKMHMTSNTFSGLQDIPSREKIRRMKKIKKEDFADPKNVYEFHKDPSYPDWYKCWVDINLNFFHPHPEVVLFSGWHQQLWKDWNLPFSSKDMPSVLQRLKP